MTKEDIFQSSINLLERSDMDFNTVKELEEIRDQKFEEIKLII